MERADNFGHTKADVEEMLMYGIKPYDDDAYVRTVSAGFIIISCANCSTHYDIGGTCANTTHNRLGRVPLVFHLHPTSCKA